MPTEEDLDTLPIADLTPYGIWIPSDFNETEPGLSFVDSHFDPPCLTQYATSIISPAGETHTESAIKDPSAPDIFYDCPGEAPEAPGVAASSTPDIFHDALGEPTDTSNMSNAPLLDVFSDAYNVSPNVGLDASPDHALDDLYYFDHLTLITLLILWDMLSISPWTQMP